MKKAVEPWRDCDPVLRQAIELFLQQWGPYSAQSRRYSIFRLFREVVDPAWADLCARHPELKIDGYSQALSELARHHGFDVLDRFLRLVVRYVDVDLIPNIDSLRELALACRNKKAKRISGTDISARRHAGTCRFCGNQTEVAAYLDGGRPQACAGVAAGHRPVGQRQPPPSEHDDPSRRLSLSAMYCSLHRPKSRFGENEVNTVYRAASRKKNQTAFNLELGRLDRQSWEGASSANAKSGNGLVDEFIWQLAVHRNLTHEQQSADGSGALEARIRGEARLLVKNRISDRKKEIVTLLTKGYTQASVARALGIMSRQAVSKALQSIPKDYRFDLLYGPSNAA